MLLAEREGFEPPEVLPFNGFQDRRDRPLCHLSNDTWFSKSGAKIMLFLKLEN